MQAMLPCVCCRLSAAPTPSAAPHFTYMRTRGHIQHTHVHRNRADYRAEAAQTERMRGLLGGDAGYRVPQVAWELCADRVIATELLPGIPLDRSMPARVCDS